MTGELEIFKTDKRGRVRVPVERREVLMDEFEKSGLSGAEFARLVGIKYATFANWRQKRNKAHGQADGSSEPGGPTGSVSGGAVRMFEAVVEGGRGIARRVNGSAAGLLIELPGGGRIEVQTPFQVRMAGELLGYMAQSARVRC
jgi:hypothetical protein